jgi:hypothetical protein
MSFTLDEDLYDVLKERFQDRERSDYVNYVLRRKIMPKAREQAANYMEKIKTETTKNSNDALTQLFKKK